MSDTDETSGMNTLDLLNASKSTRHVVRAMLRLREASYTELCEELDLPQDQIDAGLEEMLSLNWVNAREENGETIYFLEVQRKEGSEVTRARQHKPDAEGSSTMSELWDKMEEGSEAAGDGREAQRKMTDFHREEKKRRDATADRDVEPVDIAEIDAVEDHSDHSEVEPLPVSTDDAYDSSSSPAAEQSEREDDDGRDQKGGILGWFRRRKK